MFQATIFTRHAIASQFVMATRHIRDVPAGSNMWDPRHDAQWVTNPKTTLNVRLSDPMIRLPLLAAVS